MVGPFPEDPDRVVGGVEAAAYAIARALSEHEDVEKVLAVDLRTSATPGRVYSDKLEARFAKVPFINGDALVRSWFAVNALRGIAKSFRPDVVHGQGIGRPGDIATQLGLPSVVTVHGMVHLEARVTEQNLFSRLKAAALDRVVESVLGKAKVVISISEYDGRELAGMIKGRRVAIPNAVPDIFFPKEPSPPSREPVVLFAGLMRERKNVLGLVNSFVEVRRAVPEARLVIAGPTHDQAYRDAVVSRVNEAGLAGAVEFLGHVTTERLVEALSEATVLALFSREETLPTIIAQAMAAGRPVVAAAVGGIGDMIVDGKTGYLVASEDEAALADRLIAVLRDPGLAESMGLAGAANAQERYTARSIAGRTIDAYRLAMAG